MTKVKICGIKRTEDALLAARLGYDYLGFVINVAKSRRSIDLGQLREINKCLVAAGLRDRVKIVGVFVDAPIDSLQAVKVFGICDAFQLHGQEPLSYCAQIKGKVEIWKALVKRPNQSNNEYIESVKAYLPKVDKVLIDSASATDKLVGTKVTDYDELLSGFDFHNENLVLSGGINLGNIKAKLETYDPELVDLSSGVESAPGIKDAKKLTEFISIIHKLNGKA